MPRIDRYTVKEVVFDGKNNRPLIAVGELHVIEFDGRKDAVQFHCPCGCADLVYLPLRRDDVPGSMQSDSHWDYTLNGHLVWPSVGRGGACKSHFFVKADGSVTWC